MAVAVFLALTRASAGLLAQTPSAPADAALTFPLVSKWSATLADSPAFPPAYDSSFGYFSLRNGQLVAIALADGKPAWSVDCPTTAAPAAGSNLVFIGGDDRIEARAQKGGEIVWTRPVEGAVTSLYWDTGWLMATTKASLLAFRATDGEPVWKRDLGAPLHSTPALAGERLYLSLDDGTILALSLHSGDVLWTHKLDQPTDGILALGERLFFGSLNDFFYCLDTKEGKRKWRWPNDADVVGTPVIDRKRVYFVALDNLLRGLNRGGGSLAWKRSLPMRPSSGPLLVGNLLIVPGLAAELHAYSTADGTPAGDYSLQGVQGEELRLAAAPHLTPDRAIILVTKNGQLQALAGTPSPP